MERKRNGGTKRSLKEKTTNDNKEHENSEIYVDSEQSGNSKRRDFL